jgi:hypothetical protein
MMMSALPPIVVPLAVHYLACVKPTSNRVWLRARVRASSIEPARIQRLILVALWTSRQRDKLTVKFPLIEIKFPFSNYGIFRVSP